MITDVWNEDGKICYLIENIGDATAQEGHCTTLSVDNINKEEELVEVDLAPGAELERCFSYSWQCTPLENVVDVCADNKDSVNESDEENNCLEETWQCASPRDSIIYHAYRGTGIWRMNPDGSENTLLSDHGWFAEYSPDNTKIAFGEYYNNGIWVMDSNGENQKQLTKSGNDPTWSPNGKEIAYMNGSAASVTNRIWIMDADGKNNEKISTKQGRCPAWSPDGEKIAYNGIGGIWLITLESLDETQLFDGGRCPAWSPDGEKIAFRSSDDGLIWIMDADGNNKEKISTEIGTNPAWSPNGTKIAYEGKNGIWVINTDGTDEKSINMIGHSPNWM